MLLPTVQRVVDDDPGDRAVVPLDGLCGRTADAVATVGVVLDDVGLWVDVHGPRHG